MKGWYNTRNAGNGIKKKTYDNFKVCRICGKRYSGYTGSEICPSCGKFIARKKDLTRKK